MKNTITKKSQIFTFIFFGLLLFAIISNNVLGIEEMENTLYYTIISYLFSSEQVAYLLVLTNYMRSLTAVLKDFTLSITCFAPLVLAIIFSNLEKNHKVTSIKCIIFAILFNFVFKLIIVISSWIIPYIFTNILHIYTSKHVYWLTLFAFLTSFGALFIAVLPILYISEFHNKIKIIVTISLFVILCFGFAYNFLPFYPLNINFTYFTYLLNLIIKRIKVLTVIGLIIYISIKFNVFKKGVLLGILTSIIPVILSTTLITIKFLLLLIINLLLFSPLFLYFF